MRILLRTLPVVLPHDLINFLSVTNLMPEITSQEISQYWKHMAAHSEWARSCGEWTQVHPIYLWGDDAQYNRERQKVVAVALGFQLDSRKSSLQTIYPLFTYKVDFRLQ